MKRIILIISASLIAISLWGQGRVSTRSYRLADFTDKITKVVLSGNEVLDGALRQEITEGWTVSAYDFCTLEEFEALKTRPDYYFLLPAQMQFKGETSPGIVFLSLLKGGPEAAQGTSKMHEVVSIPLCPAGSSSGREFLFIGAIVDGVQSFTLSAMKSENAAYRMADWFNRNYARSGKFKSIWISQDDIPESLIETVSTGLDEDFHIVPEDEVDEIYNSGAYNSLCSYVVAPQNPGPGSYCYCMLIDAATRTIFYIQRHKISPSKPSGFIKADIKRLKVGR